MPHLAEPVRDATADVKDYHEDGLDHQEREERAKREIYQGVDDDMAERGEVAQWGGEPDHGYSPGCCKHDYDQRCRCFACSERREFLRGIGRDMPDAPDWRTPATPAPRLGGHEG